MKSMLKDAAILFAITIIAGVLLGGVFQITKDPIAKQEEAAKQAACNEVFATADSFEAFVGFDDIVAHAIISADYPNQDINDILVAKDSAGNDLGYVLTVTTHEGYGGDIQFMMGVTNEGVLNGISLLSISETAGLGMQAGEVLVPQFANKDVTKFTYTKNGSTSDSEIDAISGATITTNAVVNGVDAGLFYVDYLLGGE